MIWIFSSPEKVGVRGIQSVVVTFARHLFAFLACLKQRTGCMYSRLPEAGTPWPARNRTYFIRHI